jgi:hypothetical protein
MYKSWESLLEECTLAFMCGRLRCDGAIVAAYTSSRDEEWARKAMYQERPYLEWTDFDRVVSRWGALFVGPNALETAIRPAKSELKQMNTIRNAIAHSSVAAMRKFNDLVQGQFGGRRRLRRPSEFLREVWPQDANLTYFDRYADVLETVGTRVTG